LLLPDRRGSEALAKFERELDELALSFTQSDLDTKLARALWLQAVLERLLVGYRKEKGFRSQFAAWWIGTPPSEMDRTLVVLAEVISTEHGRNNSDSVWAAKMVGCIIGIAQLSRTTASGHLNELVFLASKRIFKPSMIQFSFTSTILRKNS
jgi:hypothetical protein